jgi:hypothetical protein
MKKLNTAIACAACCLCVSAFAQTTTAMPPGATPTHTAAQTAAPASQGQWTSPERGSASGLTRAEVYQQLVRAEDDGQLAHLNATVYAHH